MKNIFSFCNQKGGVGKTTSVINIGASLAKSGFKVLIIDMDSQANATSGLGEEKPSMESTTYQLLVENSDPKTLIRKTQYQNLDIIPSGPDLSAAELDLINRDRREYQIKEKLAPLSADYDFIFIDCPPSLSLLTINALVSSDYIIIPLQCEYYALEGLSQLLQTYHLVHSNLNSEIEIGGVLLTMADTRTNLTEQVIQEVRGYFKEKVFETIIPRTVKLSEAPSFGKPAVFYDPSNRGSKNYTAVAKEFVARFKKESKETIAQKTDQERPETIAAESGGNQA